MSELAETKEEEIQPAGENSPYLDEREQKQASERAPVGPLVIHEIIREQGETELSRSFSGLAFSSFAAGLSIGFSFLMEAQLQAGLPDTPWRQMVAGLGYTLGFLIVILGQQQLFTETTLTALIPALTRRNASTLAKTARVWVIVLVFNLLATACFAAMAAIPHLFTPAATAAMDEIAVRVVSGAPLQTGLSAVLAGWLIGLTVWLLPGAGPARPLIILLLTYSIALGRFPHIIAGSVEGFYAVITGQAGIGAYVLHFLLPTLIGNTVGGTALVALLNHAPVATELARQQALAARQ